MRGASCAHVQSSLSDCHRPHFPAVHPLPPSARQPGSAPRPPGQPQSRSPAVERAAPVCPSGRGGGGDLGRTLLQLCVPVGGQVCGNSSGIGLHNWENRSSLTLGPADGEPESLGPWGTCRSPEPPTGLLSVVPLRWLPLPAAREAKAPWGAMKRKTGSTDSRACPTCPVRAARTRPGGRGSLVLPRQ